MSTKKYLKYIRLEDSVFRRQFGVKKATFNQMVSIVREGTRGRNGPDPRLSPQDQVLLWLKYVRDYITFETVGILFCVSVSRAYKTCILVENILIKHKDFHLPGKKELLTMKDEEVAIDASESPVQRPTKKPVNVKNRKNKQKHYYSGKKKKHTIKSQISVSIEGKKILSSATANGRQHDFKLFKNSKTKINPSSCVLVDSGYQGIVNIHNNSSIPKKNSKNKKLSKKDKIQNKAISSKRIIVENVFAQLKRFKIIAEKYRNRRKRFLLRFNLIAAIYNLELC